MLGQGWYSRRRKAHHHNGELHGKCTQYATIQGINAWYDNFHVIAEVIGLYVHGVRLVAVKDSADMFARRGTDGPYHCAEQDMWIQWVDSRNWNETILAFSVGRMIDGKKHGVWIKWTDSGDMKAVEVYDNDQLLVF